MRIGIVGTGLAGVRVASTLRDVGFSGEIIAWNGEGIEPYDRPPLSKQLFSSPLQKLSDQGMGDLYALASVIPDTVDEVKPVTDGGDRHQWSINGTTVDIAVIASGAQPSLSISGALSLYTHDDALALAAAAQEGRRVDIVGAGWIGTEIAWMLASRCHVHVWEQSSTILGRTFGGAVTQTWSQWLADAGVCVHLNQVFPSSSSCLPDAHKCSSSMSDVAEGKEDEGVLTTHKPLVVQATGSRPSLDFLAEDPYVYGDRSARGALVTDGWTRVLGGGKAIPGLYAVGDCADGIVAGGHWSKALHDAQWTVSDIMGSPTPRFRAPAEVFSTQFGHDIGFVGEAIGTFIRQESDSGWFIRWELEGELKGLLAVDSPRELSRARKELRRR